MKKLVILLIAVITLVECKENKEPLKIGYSDWPGWVAWQIAINKGWFKEEGVDVKFSWFEYSPSLNAFASGQLDGVTIANTDVLRLGASGTPNKMILISDYSNGNDMIVALPGIDSIKELKNKKIGVEIGTIDHLLLFKALQNSGLKQSDISLVNVPTYQTAQTLASGQVSAIGAWQPNSGEALKAIPGSKTIYSSADTPGLIFDGITVSPSSLQSRRKDWEKVIKVWYRIIDYLNNPDNMKEALKIMSGRSGVSPKEYAVFMKGTHFLSKEEVAKVLEKNESLMSIYGSSNFVDKFNLKNNIYKKSQDATYYIDGSLMLN